MQRSNFKSNFSSFIDFVAKKGSRDGSAELVLFHIRARGLVKSKRHHIWLSCVASFLLSFGRFFSLLKALLGDLKGVIVGAVAAASVYLFIDVHEFEMAFVFLCSLILFNLEKVAVWCAAHLFDVLDFVSIGLATKLYTRAFIASRKSIGGADLSELPPLVLHIYCSRQLLGWPKEKKEEDDFFSAFANVRHDDNAVNFLVSDYWSRQE
jgi:hypothetical protein